MHFIQGKGQGIHQRHSRCNIKFGRAACAHQLHGGLVGVRLAPGCLRRLPGCRSLLLRGVASSRSPVGRRFPLRLVGRDVGSLSGAGLLGLLGGGASLGGVVIVAVHRLPGRAGILSRGGRRRAALGTALPLLGRGCLLRARIGPLGGRTVGSAGGRRLIGVPVSSVVPGVSAQV